MEVSRHRFSQDSFAHLGVSRPALRAAEYVVKDTQYTRMSYLIEGPRGDGTVHLEMKKPKGGSPSVRYLFADVQGMTGRTQRIVIEDNRIEDEQPSVAAE
eukprot:TRINITY_DN7287_c0_g1_i1.p1 TRINITY_DN7287_c0_g1~~TRINITY_DN7287_c0_g1_i1.p1  ORF type:complete len:100 (+),score=19.16 TRINITY_DN7287_c0_g1_i1:126-425(+)